METFYFHIDYGALERDEVGTPCTSLIEARSNAVALLGELLRDSGDDFWAKPNVTITVTDASGLVLWVLETSGHASAAVSGAAAL